MKSKTLICLLALISFSAYAYAGCWNPRDKADQTFAELEDSVELSFKDAVSCKSLDDATVELGSQRLKTSFDGVLSLDAAVFEEMGDRKIPIIVRKKGYITLKTHLIVRIGSVWNKRFLLSQRMPIGQMRFVLQWGEKPRDLDLHLKGAGWHISYQDLKQVSARAKLDRDATRGFGPETITLKKIEDGKRYQLFVHRYAGGREFEGQEQVFVYKDNQLDRIFNLPETGQPYVHLLEINDHNIQYLNLPAPRPMN